MLLVSVLVGFAGPAWWSQRGVLTPEAAPDDFALATRATPLARFVHEAIDAAGDAAGGRITFAEFMALAGLR